MSERRTPAQVAALMDDLCGWSDLPRALCSHCQHPHAELPEVDEQATPKPARPGNWRDPSPAEDRQGFATPAAVTMPVQGQPCQRCGALAGDAYLCPACIDQLEVWLADLPMLDRQLEVTMTRQDRVRRPTPRTVAPPPDHAIDTTDPQQAASIIGKRAPWRRAASDTRSVLRSELVTSVRLLVEQRGQQAPQLGTVEEMARWLSVASGSVARDPGGVGIVDGIGKAHARAVRCIDTAPERRWVGECTACHQRLTAVVGAQVMRCPTCWAVHQVTDLVEARDQRVSGNVGSVAACIDMAQVCGYRLSRNTIKSWIHRGQLAGAGVGDVDGPTVYRMGDVLDLLRRRDAGSSERVEA